MKRPPRRRAFRFPSGTGPMHWIHKGYLESRRFDAERLEREWGLMGTGPVALLDNRDYKWRIIAPVRWEGRVVTFQGRSISDKADPRYKACPKDRELILHQDILYGKETEWGEVGICVEGITDVWRFGLSAFAVFGIDYRRAQVRAIAKRFRRVAVVFDDDPQAVVRAKKLVAELQFRGVTAWHVPIVGDPGGMRQDDADHLVREITK